MSQDQGGACGSSGAGAGPSRSTSSDPTTLAELLSSEENKGANLVSPLTWCPHLETSVNKDLPTPVSNDIYKGIPGGSIILLL